MIELALDEAATDPSGVGCVEAHGTGTPLGDPIEYGALCAVGLTPGPRRVGSPVLGASKASQAHTEGTAGVVGLLKAVRCATCKVDPPTLHLRCVNPHLKPEKVGLASILVEVSARSSM